MEAVASELPSLAVHLTGRLSALLFVVALVAPAMAHRASRHSAALFKAFLAAQTIHFAAVLWLASATGGAHLFPGDRSLQEAGGWSTVLAIFVFFYFLGFVGLTARRTGSAAGRWLRVADRVATMAIGFMFVATYVPLVTRSRWFLAPTAILILALGVYVLGSQLRRVSHFRRHRTP